MIIFELYFQIHLNRILLKKYKIIFIITFSLLHLLTIIT